MEFGQADLIGACEYRSEKRGTFAYLDWKSKDGLDWRNQNNDWLNHIDNAAYGQYETREPVCDDYYGAEETCGIE